MMQEMEVEIERLEEENRELKERYAELEELYTAQQDECHALRLLSLLSSGSAETSFQRWVQQKNEDID